ncbi:MAG: hypothetical protein K0S45_3379 [Nitrospira sp.]|jgi:hypothetical protein|nr:hypothetical protein [Nitrospira sp.]
MTNPVVNLLFATSPNICIPGIFMGRFMPFCGPDLLSLSHAPNTYFQNVKDRLCCC